MALAAAHAFEDHTADVRLRVAAPDLPTLFGEAARALGELMGGDVVAGDLGEPVRARARARDREALLVAWIDELIYLSEVHKRVWTDIRIERLEGGEIVASLRGPKADALRTAPKAATFHELRVDESPDGVRAMVVLDV